MAVDRAVTAITDITNSRRRMSSPGGEETGEGGQFFAPVLRSLGEGGSGAHILTRCGDICPAPCSQSAESNLTCFGAIAVYC
jgi:hypothetical protein